MFNDKQRERLERARSEPMDHWIESEDPLIVKVENPASGFSASRNQKDDGEVENEQSGSVHTVIPDALDCSCPDSTYRDFIDKHMLYLIEQDDEAGTAMRGALKSHQEELKERLSEIQSERIEIQSEIGQVREIFGLIDQPSDQDKSVQRLADEIIQDHS